MEEIVQQLWAASEKKRKCRITLVGEPLPRMIHPYGVCKTSANHIVIVCWQEMGFTKAGGKSGYRNLSLPECQSVELLSSHFQKRDDFNPLDDQYKEWVYHI